MTTTKSTITKATKNASKATKALDKTAVKVQRAVHDQEHRRRLRVLLPGLAKSEGRWSGTHVQAHQAASRRGGGTRSHRRGRRKAHCRAKACRQDRRCQEARGLPDRQEDRQEERGQLGGEGQVRRERFACARVRPYENERRRVDAE